MSAQGTMIKAAVASKCALAIGPPAVSDARAHAGVAVLARASCKATQIKPRTEAFRKFRDAGRVIAVTVDLGLCAPV
eukprot:9570204-Alexandrium_andersonii.AAC.1